MVNWDKYFSRVMPEVKGVPAPMAIQAIRDSAREFCQKTWVWQDNVPYEVQEDQREILVVLPDDTRLVSVVYLLENGNYKQLPEDIYIKAKDSPIDSEFEADKSREYEARVALKPSESCAGGPDWLYNDHAESVAHGAKARLMYDARKDWGHPDLAMMHHQLFRKAIAAERIRMQQGYTRKAGRIKPRRFV